MSTSNQIERRRLQELPGEIHEEITMAERKWHEAVVHAIKAGDGLIEAKALVKHGEWGPWLREHLPEVPQRTARRYMQLARNRSRVADLPTVREAIAALAKPKEATEPGPEKATLAEIVEILHKADRLADDASDNPHEGVPEIAKWRAVSAKAWPKVLAEIEARA